MNVFVSGKNMPHSPAQLRETAARHGQYYSSDRFYTLANCLMTEAVRRASKTMSLVMSFLFRSYNYKHNSHLYVKPPRWIIAVDVFCWLCVVGFVVCLIMGVARPLISAIIAISTNPIGSPVTETFARMFSSSGSIASVVVCLICFAVALTYIYVLKNIVKANRGMSLGDYVCRKLSFIRRFGSWARLDDKFRRGMKLDKLNKKAEKQVKNFRPGTFVILSDAQVMGSSDRWLVMQVLDILYRLFPDVGIFLEFSDFDSGSLESLKKIAENDFKNIVLTAMPA